MTPRPLILDLRPPRRPRWGRIAYVGYCAAMAAGSLAFYLAANHLHP